MVPARCPTAPSSAPAPGARRGKIWSNSNTTTSALWDELADVFLTWCRRGVDGFRCDAGYKVPVPAWQYIIARVQQEFPETIFLLEGLGGSVGSHGSSAHRRRHAMGLLGAVPELFRRGGRQLSRSQPAAERPRRPARALQRNPRQRPARRARPRLVAAAQPALRADQRERRVRVHLRRRMARDGKDQGPWQHAAWLGAVRRTSCPNWRG